MSEEERSSVDYKTAFFVIEYTTIIFLSLDELQILMKVIKV